VGPLHPGVPRHGLVSPRGWQHERTRTGSRHLKRPKSLCRVLPWWRFFQGDVRNYKELIALPRPCKTKNYDLEKVPRERINAGGGAQVLPLASAKPNVSRRSREKNKKRQLFERSQQKPNRTSRPNSTFLNSDTAPDARIPVGLLRASCAVRRKDPRGLKPKYF